MTDVFIVSATRTPIGRFGSALASLSPMELGAHAMKAALGRAGVDGGALDGYAFGNVLSGGHGQHIPRQAAHLAGIPDEVDGYHVNMVCSSGMLAMMNAAMHLRGGLDHLFLAGGTESMSQTGFYLSHGARWGYKFLGGRTEPLVDLLAYDGLTDPLTDEIMGNQTERLIAELGIAREDIDAVAAASHQRAAAATESGALLAEIEPIEIQSRKGSTLVDRDEGIRPDTTAEGLAKLRPAFEKDGKLTAGNASQISDGAAALVLASGEAVEAHGLTPIARVLGGTWSAGPGYQFAQAPVPAVRKLMKRTGLAIEDVDLFENNEAFAVNSVIFEQQLGVSQDKLNVHGGAVALGHPIGATGARIIVTLLGALQARDKSLGVATLCHGTGGSTAVAIERLS